MTKNGSEENGAKAETVTSEKIFGRLGPPPKQPRTQKFAPQCGRAGRGTRRMRSEEPKARHVASKSQKF